MRTHTHTHACMHTCNKCHANVKNVIAFDDDATDWMHRASDSHFIPTEIEVCTMCTHTHTQI